MKLWIEEIAKEPCCCEIISGAADCTYFWPRMLLARAQRWIEPRCINVLVFSGLFYMSNFLEIQLRQTTPGFAKPVGGSSECPKTCGVLAKTKIQNEET